MKKELLVPAGDLLSFKAALHAGADAIYVGGKRFGARKFASNFDNEELKEIVEYAHLYGVKVYVTVNTMIYEKEMEDVLEYVKYFESVYQTWKYMHRLRRITIQNLVLIYWKN